jgi:hypothetical protein
LEALWRPSTSLEELLQNQRAIVRFISRRVDQGDRALFGLALEQFDQVGFLSEFL